MKRVSSITLALLAVLSLTSIVLAASNQSIQAESSITQAKKDVADMQAAGIPTNRVNESLSEALQLYEAQQALESRGVTGNYERILKDTADITSIKQNAFKAKDEMKVFDETYNAAAKDINVSAMQPDVDEIHKSFQEERFEDTLTLIDKGYTRLSEIQASQTAVRLFYDSSSRGIKNFFIRNWITILIVVAVILVIAILFWATIKRIRIKMKLYNLNLQKETLNSLIKKLQSDYFKYGKISETEYKVKIDKFKEMIRDLDRKIPLLKEEMLKLQKEKPKEIYHIAKEKKAKREVSRSKPKRRKR